LLGVLTVLNAGFLFLVIATKPFRDSKGHTGWTVGDKAQVVAQIGLLVECAMVAFCLTTSTSEGLPVLLEMVVVVTCLGAIIFPIIYMQGLGSGRDFLACLWPKEEDVIFKHNNPIHDEGAD
jgi:hypothetical protein